MPLHDHCCTCDLCRMMGGCLQFNFDSPPTANTDLGVTFYNLPEWAADYNGVELVGGIGNFFHLGDPTFHNDACFFQYGHQLDPFGRNISVIIQFTTRDTVDVGGPCVEVSFSFGGWLGGTGTCASIGDQMCSGFVACFEDTQIDFNINQLCRCEPILIGETYSAGNIRALITTCPGGPRPPVSYNCVDSICIDPIDGTGEFETREECLEDGCHPPDCTLWDGCADMQLLTIIISNLQNCIDGADSKTYSNLNNDEGSYELDPATDFASVSCVAQSLGNFYVKLGDYESADTGGGLFLDRYADPGLAWETSTVAGTHRDEYYICAIAVETTCTDGLVSLTAIHFLRQGWRVDWDGADFTIVSGYFSPGCIDYNTPTVTSTAPADDCTTSGEIMCSSFDYDLCGSTETFNVCGIVGPIA